MKVSTCRCSVARTVPRLHLGHVLVWTCTVPVGIGQWGSVGQAMLLLPSHCDV